MDLASKRLVTTLLSSHKLTHELDHTTDAKPEVTLLP
jgi:hypothetical protein